MVDEGVEVVRALPKGANHDAGDTAKGAKFSLHRTDVALLSAAIGLVPFFYNSMSLVENMNGRFPATFRLALWMAKPN